MKEYFNKSDLFSIILLIVLSWYAWRLLPELTIRSDGFIYLLERTHRWFWGQKYAISGFETAAVVFGGLFSKLFGPNIPLYLWTEIIVVLLISVFFYIFVKILTKRSIVAFSGALIASSSYFGNWDMLGIHCYCFFLERVTVVPILLTSFIFLHLCLERSKLKYYFISIGTYFLGVGLAHFSVLFTPAYLLYPFFYRFFNHRKKKDIVGGGLIGISYLLLSCFFVLIQQINESGLRPTWGFFEFLFNPQKFPYFEKMIHQLVFWSQYPPLLQNIDDSYPFTYLTVENASSIALWVVVVYIVSGVLIYLRLPKHRPILLTSIFGIATIFYLNAYFHLYDIAQPDSSRYFYFPTFLLAIFWSYFLWAAFFQRKVYLLIAMGLLILTVYYYVNTWLIESKIKEITSNWERSTIAIFDKMRKINDSLNKGTVVIGSYPEIGPQEAEFFTEKLGKGRVVYVSEDNPEWRSIASSSAHAIKLSYDKNCECVRQTKLK